MELHSKCEKGKKKKKICVCESVSPQNSHLCVICLKHVLFSIWLTVSTVDKLSVLADL